MINKETLQKFGRTAAGNAVQFAVNLAFIFAYTGLFGMENIMPAIAVGVGFTMLPKARLDIRPLTMAGIVMVLYAGGGLTAQLALASPWLAFPCNLLFVALILLLTCEPSDCKPSISFLLCFVFCQSAPVPAHLFPMRFLGTAAAGGFVAAVTAASWCRRGDRDTGRTLMEQIRLCAARCNRAYILRMSLGIAAAMFAGTVLGLKKPLWISIVVMSLTQIDIQETFQRIRHRAFATAAGIAVFVVVFQLLVPPQYSTLAVMALGYISFFTPEYKHKQVVNAISAINASLVLIDPSTAIVNRTLCLLGGILIVLFLYILERLLREGRSRFTCRRTMRRDAGNA